MRSNVLSLVQPVHDKSEALAVIDSLRAAVESGEVKAFACVGIEPNHNTQMWASSTQPTSRLELIGAMHHLLHSYESE